MFCTTVIPTIGRPQLDRAVNSVLDQDFQDADFEIVVVNDSGKPLLSKRWVSDPRVHLITTYRRERCVARNTGAAIARGKYLHFLDEDDWLLPGALSQLWSTSRAQRAVWYYGGARIVDRSGRHQALLMPTCQGNCFVQIMAGEWIPPGASLIEAEIFFAVGGYDPGILYSEDVDLCRRVALRGGLYGSTEPVACLELGETGSTTNYQDPGRKRLWGREKTLEDKTAFARLRSSAQTPFWKGRILRVYLTSLVWNLQHRRWGISLHRLATSLQALVGSGRAMAHPEYWQAVRTAYQSPSFHVNS